MRRHLLALTLAAVFFASCAVAEPLGGKLDQFSVAFNNAAKTLKNPTRVAKSSCSAEVRATCSFVVTDNINIIATSMQDKATLGDITIHMDGRPDQVPVYFRTLDVLMKMYAPGSSDDERRVILGQLVQQIANKPTPKVTLDGLNISVLLVPGVASLTSVDRGDIGMDTTAEPLIPN